MPTIEFIFHVNEIFNSFLLNKIAQFKAFVCTKLGYFSAWKSRMQDRKKMAK